MNKTRKMVITALFTAFVCVSTMIIKIPTPTNGYVNLGDAMVLVSAYILGPVWGTFAAGVGSMLADLLSGYGFYAPATLIIKAAVAAAAFGLAFVLGKKITVSSVKYIVSGFIAEIIMVGGYLLFESTILGEGAAALASVPGNIFQAVVGVILSILLMKVKALKNIQ